MPATVLVCEDHALVRGLLASVLAGAGYEVIETGDVPQARAALAAAEVALVVVDLHLRGGSGLELVRELRGAERDTPVILMSGDFHEADARCAARYGVNATLPKPFEPDELLAAVSALL